MWSALRRRSLDVSFAARLMLHWADLGNRDPTVKIVCRNYSETPQFGSPPWDNPNLLWELMRAGVTNSQHNNCSAGTRQRRLSRMRRQSGIDHCYGRVLSFKCVQPDCTATAIPCLALIA